VRSLDSFFVSTKSALWRRPPSPCLGFCYETLKYKKKNPWSGKRRAINLPAEKREKTFRNDARFFRFARVKRERKKEKGIFDVIMFSAKSSARDEEANNNASSAAQLAAMQQRKDNQYNARMAVYDWLDRLVLDKRRFFTTFLAYSFCVIVLGVYIGDWNSATMPGREQGQWCAMQAKECKRQADVCLVSGGMRAGSAQPMVGLDKERAFMEGGDIGGTDFDGAGVPQHIQQMHSEWTQSRDNRAATVARLKELRVNLLCHELRVQAQRKKGALDYDRINSFMAKAGKARDEYEKLEAVVKVVYPEVIPEVEELDQMKNPDCKHVHGGRAL